MKHKLLSILLCLTMALSLLPTAALADEGGAAANDGTEAHPYTLTELGTMTRDQYIAAQGRLGGTMYVDVGNYSYTDKGVLGNGERNDTPGQVPDHSKLNAYGENGYLNEKNDGANGKNIVFVDGKITSGVTGYTSIDNIGTSLLLAVPAYTNVTFEGITFNNVMSFDYQLYTGPWSQLGELKFDGCTFNGIIVGAIAAQTLTFNKCTFTNYTNTTDANNSNPTWIRPAYGNWTKGDNEGQGDNFKSLTTINFTGNTVTSTRPVKFEYISQWDITSTVTATGNSFDISAQPTDRKNEIKNVGLYLGAHTSENAFNLVAENNTRSANTAALYTIPKGTTSLPVGSTVKDSQGNDTTLTDALEWKTTTELTLETNYVAEVGGTKYPTLTEAFAALNGTNHTLTLIDGSQWDAATPVYWKAGDKSGYVAKLTDALTAAYKANASDITIVCRPGADVGTMTHGHVADDLTIYGNNAYLSGGECDLEVDTFEFNRTTGAQVTTENANNAGSDLTDASVLDITAYELDNLGVWGQRFTNATINISLTDCDGNSNVTPNVQRVYISGTSGVNNITLTGCDFLTKATAVYSNADGSIMINNCSFTGGQVPVNFNHKANGTQTVTVKNSKFENCGDNNSWKQFAAPIRFVNSGTGTMTTEVDTCTITGTVGSNGDILIGDGRTNETSNDVTLTVSGTDANVQAQKPGYYAANGTVAAAGNVSKTTIPASETPTTIKLESNKDFMLAEVNGFKTSNLREALDNASSFNKPIKLLSADTALVQAILDGQYGSIDGLTIELPTGNYGQLELGRATKYEGSNTEYYVGGFDESAANYQEFNSAEALKTYKNGGGWTPLCYYVRNMSDVTLKAADGATVNVAGVKMTSGHMYGSSGAPNYDYVLDREVPSTNESYYLAQTVSNITFVGLNFTAKSDINTSNEETVINGFTFKNCTFNINNTASGNQAIRYYNENNNGKVSNLVVDNCKFNNCFQGVYTSHIKNVFVTNSEFDTTRHNAIAIQDFNGACDHGKVIITGNTFKNIGDRIIRFGNVGADTQITITHNTVIGELIKKEVIKAESLADGVTCNIHSNSWGDGATVANDQFKDTAAPSYSGSSSSYDPTYSVSTPSKTENGSVTVSPKSASKGDTVTVTVKPDSGYVLETLTVTDKNGNELTLKDKGNGKYTFTMPAGKVEVKATFMEDNSMLNFFYDVPNNAYFYEAVKWAVENGITTGVGNDLFAPEQPCTRAQIVTFLWRAAGSPEPKDAASGMTDVVSGSYYEKAVAWAIENGITTGTTTSTFSPDVTCTRAQAVTFLARALSAKAASAAEFSDVPTGSYFADAVAWAAANGVTEGIGGGLFGSDNDCTRGQIVTFLYRAYNK